MAKQWKQNNIAAMREALEQIASIPMPPPIEQAQQTAAEMRDIAIAALAEPPRNCDRFSALYDAVVTWGREDQNWSDWPDEDAEDVNDLLNILTGDQIHELIDWLYAPATEKKGGTDEQK